MVVNPGTRAMERVSFLVDQTSEEEYQESLEAWDYAIVDWKGFKDPNGVEIPCTKENKLKLIRIPKAMRFFQRVFQILNGEAAKSKGGVEKNSLTG